MTEGQDRARVTLPPPGWMPDPSLTDYERYWDGRAWTARVRDRWTHVEFGPAQAAPATQAAPASQARADVRRATRRSWRRPLVAVSAVVVATFVAGYMGWLPAWVPFADALRAQAPHGPAVAYPVFGSDELVVYLARSMVAQEPEIDVTHWMFFEGYDLDQINDAFQEAAVQNPHVFVKEWEVSGTTTKMVVTPTYQYTQDEAMRRRSQVTVAVLTGVEASGATAAVSDAEKVAAIHRYIASKTTYDYVAYNEGQAGHSSLTSARVAQGQQAYAALVEGTAVCNGYSEAFQLMAEELGLETVMVTGEVSEGVIAGLHAWNRVLVDGRWLTVDVTWDDAVGTTATSDYLLLEADAPVLATRASDLYWVVDANAGAFGE